MNRTKVLKGRKIAHEIHKRTGYDIQFHPIMGLGDS